MYSRQAQVSLITDRLKVGDNARFFERPLNGLFLRRFPLLTTNCFGIFHRGHHYINHLLQHQIEQQATGNRQHQIDNHKGYLLYRNRYSNWHHAHWSVNWWKHYALHNTTLRSTTSTVWLQFLQSCFFEFPYRYQYCRGRVFVSCHNHNQECCNNR